MKVKPGQYIQVGAPRGREFNFFYKVISRRKTANKDKILYTLQLISQRNHHHSAYIEVKSTTLNSKIQQGCWKIAADDWLAKHFLKKHI